MADLYPMIFNPVLKDYIWGGRNLEKIGRILPPEGVIAESWEIAAHKDGATCIKNGIFDGMLLSELLNMLGTDLVGENNQWAVDRGIFPLLIKNLLIDFIKNSKRGICR